MSTWVPGCLVTSSDGSVGVSPSVGGGSALSSVSGNIVDTSTYSLAGTTITTQNVNVAIITAPATPATFTLKKGASYMLYAPCSVQFGSITYVAATTAIYTITAAISIPNGAGGFTTSNLDQWTGVLGIVGFPITGTQSLTLSAPIVVPSNAGPAVGTTGYDPNYVKGCYIAYYIAVAGATSVTVNNIAVGTANLTGSYDGCVISRVL